VIRLLPVLLAAIAVAGIGSARADAARECEGLLVCIPVQGPWVQVQGGGAPTYWQLSCPGRGHVIGGLDADRSGRLEITFLGALGGPVGPGVTTGRSAVFVARTPQRLSAFRPLLGCIPGGGGGARGRTGVGPAPPTRRLTAAAPVEEAAIRRVKTVAVPNRASIRITHGCLAGERLLDSSQAVAFRSRRAPTAAVLGSVRATSRRAGERIQVTVRSSVARPVAARVLLQVHAICARLSP
jgi:hypothetical protein